MNNTKNITVLEFGNQNIPLPTESRNTSDSTYVNWGLNNQYPAFILDIYNQSAIHSAIVNQKTNYIIGDGLKTKSGAELDFSINPSDSIKEFTSKIIKDYLLFNAFAVEVIFNVFGKPVEFHHIPLHKLRMNRNKNKFWFCEDWLLSRKYITYDRYSVKQNSDSTSKVFYFDGYFPSVNLVYTTPEYAGTIKAIVTDAAIKEFNLNNIKNHFSPSTIITFFNGANVPEEVKKQVIDEIDTKFRGESGKKYIVDFQHKDGKAAEIKQLSANDWDKAYLTVAENNVADILIGHQVQNPELFAIQVPGKLGNSQSLEISYEIFKNNYIQVKRDEIESALNQLFTGFESITEKVEFADKQLFNERLSDTTKEKVFTINELRKIAGLPPLPDGDKLLTNTPAPIAPVQNTEQPIVDDVKKKPSSKKLTEQDYELIKDLGVGAEDFDIIEEVKHSHEAFDAESDIANYIIENDIRGLKIGELVKVLDNEGGIKTTESELQGILTKLNDSGVVKVDKDKAGTIKVTPNNLPEVPNTDMVSVMYKYIKKPEISGADLIPTSRSFCVKLIENNRLYTREDIQSMSAIFGYDVFTHAGGWYYNPDTEETLSSCRHQWQKLKVKKKA